MSSFNHLVGLISTISIITVAFDRLGKPSTKSCGFFTDILGESDSNDTSENDDGDDDDDEDEDGGEDDKGTCISNLVMALNG